MHNGERKNSFKLKENSRIHLSDSELKENFLTKVNVASRLEHNRLPVQKSQKRHFKHKAIKIKSHVNWVEMGVAGTVKNQMNCGSCYAFATVTILFYLSLI